MKLIARDERGSIPLFLGVMIVASALIMSTVLTVESSLRSSRRAGDSANALQVADAGVNEAIQQAPTVPKTLNSFTRTVNLGAGGSYTYTATRDPVRLTMWHIDAVGTDPAGVKRHVKADAVPTSLFNSPLFVNSTLDLGSGISLDSFSNGMTYAGMCTKKGVIGTNDPDSMNFGNSGVGLGVNNCQKLLGLDSTWDYSMDGCTSFGPGSQNLPPIGPGKCPPAPSTFRTPPKKFTPAAVFPPGTPSNTTPADYTGDTLTCDPTKLPTPDPNRRVQSLEGGKIYYYNSVTLLGGCRVTNPVLTNGGAGPGVDIEKPVYVYSASKVDIGNANGLGGSINEPPALNATVCGGTAASTLVDGKANPAYFYCPAWAGGLRIRVLSGAAGPVTIRSSKTQFWGSIEVPTGSFALTGSQIEVWGAAVSQTGTSNAQFTWHFDDSLSAITAGQYGSATWHEVPN